MLEGRLIRDIRPIALTRVQAHLVVEPELSLIDCGYSGSAPRIARAIQAAGRSMDELARVICTHGHPDHAGGARELALAGVAILSVAGRRAAPAVQGGSRPDRGRRWDADRPGEAQDSQDVDHRSAPLAGLVARRCGACHRRADVVRRRDRSRCGHDPPGGCRRRPPSEVSEPAVGVVDARRRQQHRAPRPSGSAIRRPVFSVT